MRDRVPLISSPLLGYFSSCLSFVFKMYLFIYSFGLCWADSVSYLKVTRMEPFGQSPIFQLCQGQSVLLYLSAVKNTHFKSILLLFPSFSFSFSYTHSFDSDTLITSPCLLSFFLLPLFVVCMLFFPCFSFPGLTSSAWVDLKQLPLASGISLGLGIWEGSR